jgi:YqaJ-like viral recombinase domain
MTTIECYPIHSREEWLKMREQDLTASDIPAICGINPHRSALQVYAEKQGIVRVEENNIMRRGRWFQPAILAALREGRPDLHIWEPNCYYRDPELRIGATPDFFACPTTQHDFGEGAPTMVIEGKVVAAPVFRSNWIGMGDEDGNADALPDAWEQEELLKAPIYYEMQAMIQARLACVTEAIVAALVHDTWSSELYRCPVAMEHAFEPGNVWDFIVERSDKFHWCLKTETPPAETLLPSIDAKLLSKIYPRDDGPALDLSGDRRIGHLFARYEHLHQHCKAGKDALKDAEKELEAVKTEIRCAMGMSGRATYPGFEVTLKAINVKPNAGYSYRKLNIKRTK